jgi:uncharacterized protein (TIGR03089 family)
VTAFGSAGPLVPAGLLARAMDADPNRPLLTVYDDEDDSRVELSVSTVDNWMAKTANLLVHGGHGSSGRAAVLAPPHWQTAVVLLGCWAAGWTVVHGRDGGAPGPTDGPIEVAFAATDQVGAADESGAEDVYVLSLTPFGTPASGLAVGLVDFAGEVRGYGDSFHPAVPADPAAQALLPALSGGGSPTLSQAELVAAAADRADELGVPPGARLLAVGTDRIAESVGAPEPYLGWLDWLLLPLVVGGSLVLVRRPRTGLLAERARNEQVTAAIGASIDGVTTLAAG